MNIELQSWCLLVTWPFGPVKQVLSHKIILQITTKMATTKSIHYRKWIPEVCKSFLFFFFAGWIWVPCPLLLGVETNSWCSVSRCLRPTLLVNAVQAIFVKSAWVGRWPVCADLCLCVGCCYVCHPKKSHACRSVFLRRCLLPWKSCDEGKKSSADYLFLLIKTYSVMLQELEKLLINNLYWNILV